MSDNQKRFKLFIDREVQGTLAKRFALQWVSLGICLFMMTAALHLLRHPFSSFDALSRSYLHSYGVMFLVLAALTPAFIWDAIKLSNRFAGPVSRLREALRSLASGDETPALVFRSKDFWQDLAANFNEVREVVMTARRETTESSGEAEAELETAEA